MNNIIVSLLLLAAATLGEKLPHFSIKDDMRSASPQMYVTFPNGEVDSFILEPYQAIKHIAPIPCTFNGHLSKSPETSSVAVTGCMEKPGDRVEVTLISEYEGEIGRMFEVDFEGNTKKIESPFKLGRGTDDILIPPRKPVPGIKNESTRESCTPGTSGCSVPAKVKATIKLGYEDNFKDRLESEGMDVQEYMNNVMAHTQALYKHPSLKTEIHFEVLGDLMYFPGRRWKATNEDLSEARTLIDTSADVFGFWCAEDDPFGTVGMAYLEGACFFDYRVGLNEFVSSFSGAATLFAHELGHNFGMNHDFAHTESCTGIMDYGDKPSTWSSCSVSDFQGYYTSFMKDCLDTIGDLPETTTTSTTAGPSTTDGPSTTCGSPSWANDEYCDDENNNEGCNYDNGACCNNNADGWNKYCSECKCLSSTTTTTTSTTTEASPSTCGSPNWATDEYCDDENNNEGCNYDNGACCNNNADGWNNYCSECKCLTTTTTTSTTTEFNPACGSPQWATDNYCDDENNNEGCNYDNGACCNTSFEGWDSYCSECKCLTTTTTTSTTTEFNPACGSPQWVNDLYCDDENNNAGCNYDNGACCNKSFWDWDKYCSDCECHVP